MEQPTRLAVEEILSTLRPPPAAHAVVVARSRLGREVLGWRIGDGPRSVSLIAGAHADEPVGPMMLARLVTWLSALPGKHALLRDWRWSIVPHINPDGAAVNDGWASRTAPATDSSGSVDRGYLLSAYLNQVVRERPGDDLEFGFPRPANGGAPDADARPEAAGVARFMAEGAPLTLHGSFHSMGFAAGPWFLLDRDWVDRTVSLRRRIAATTQRMGYRLHDVDRKGEKGFTRIEEGFCTRPDSKAMRRHFLDRGEPHVAELFRPSSMETARALGGDPLTIVSEMPLFLVDSRSSEPGSSEVVPLPIDLESRQRFKVWAARVAREEGTAALEQAARSAGISAMPIRDQMRLQLQFLDAALEAVSTRVPEVRQPS